MTKIFIRGGIIYFLLKLQAFSVVLRQYNAFQVLSGSQSVIRGCILGLALYFTSKVYKGHSQRATHRVPEEFFVILYFP